MKSDSPRIVIINGVTANVPEPDMTAVSASRASVKQVAHMLASALAPEIRVNTVNIGVIDTERQAAKYKKTDQSFTYLQWKEQEARRRGIPLERMGTVEEVVPMILLLLISKPK
jgi:NAD(P)-dependent dehydrogenase (short-subunit alcohol dehydrogenase family)